MAILLLIERMQLANKVRFLRRLRGARRLLCWEHWVRRSGWVLFWVLVGLLSSIEIGAADTAPTTTDVVRQQSTDGYSLPPHAVGSTYVPLDNWVYPAVERLAALGVVRTQFLGLRPWSRIAVQEILREAFDESGAGTSFGAEADHVLAELSREFHDENQIEAGKALSVVRIESWYSRSTYISGLPLNDSYHFGQTIINDYGRPYEQGFSQINGFSARAEKGRFAFYVQGEYQHAPGALGYPPAVRQVIAQIDSIPLQPTIATPTRDQFRLLDSYVETSVLGHNVSLGKQSLSWGPGEGGAMIMSNNAEPFYMFRINRAEPLRIRGFSKIFGPIRYDNFFGRLAWHQFPPQPFMYGNKISLKPTPNLEVGFSRTAVFAGEGLTPLTLYTFLHSFISITSSTNLDFDMRRSAGARHGGFDFSYRLPGLRNWVTLYSDSVLHDDISPIDAPRGAAFNPGIYISHFPKLPKLDFRAEAVNTDPPVPRSNSGQFIYWEWIYRDAYLNKGNLMGNWIGREGKGIQVWTTYWLSPMSSIQLGYRHAQVAKDFIPQGETAYDFSAKVTLRLRCDFDLQGTVQYESWLAPLLAPNRQTNVLGSFLLTYRPKHFLKRSD
jgi:Capsule assembly protein Wzi